MSVENFGYKQELNRVLTLKDLVIYGLIFMVPIAPFGVFGPVWSDSQGMIALTYLIGMVAMFFTAMSYWSMSKAFPISGSVYAYAQHGIHEHVGFFAGWLILLDYILIPSLLYIVSASAISAILPDIPAMVWVVLFIVINSVVNFFGIQFTATTNRYVLVAEIIVLAIFVVIGLYALYSGPNATGLTLNPMYNADKFTVSTVFTAVSIAVLSFLGFDGISTLSEETKGGADTVGKASLLALLIVGVLFILQTWIAADIASQIQINKDNLDNAFYEVAFFAGGTFLQQLTIWATVIAWGFANALAAQAAISRILFAMGRDRQLPSFLAKVHPKYKTPYVSTIIVAIISLISSYFFIGEIENLSRLVNFGALTSFLVLHCSVIIHFVIRQKSTNLIRYLVFPLLGLLIIGYVLYEMEWKAKQLGLIWLGVGFVYFIIMRVVFKNKTSLKLDE